MNGISRIEDEDEHDLRKRKGDRSNLEGPHSRDRYSRYDTGRLASFRRHRQTYRHLAVVLLAQSTAVLPRHTDRMLALLVKTRVVNDPVQPVSRVRVAAEPSAAPARAAPYRTTPTSPRNDAATGVARLHAPVPDVPPAARRSCAELAASALGNSPSILIRDRYAQALHKMFQIRLE